MPIYEHGYRHFEGARTGHARRILAIAMQGIRQSWKSNWLKRVVLFSWAPFLYLSVVFFMLGRFTEITKDPAQLMSTKAWLGGLMGMQAMPVLDNLLVDPTAVRQQIWDGIFFFFISRMQVYSCVVVLAMVGSQMLSEDLRFNTYQLYISRPLSRIDYLIGKYLAAAFPVAMVTVIPAIVLYILSILFSPSIGAVLDTWRVLVSIALYWVLILTPVLLVLMAFSSCTSNGRYVSFAWFAMVLLSFLCANLLAMFRADPQLIAHVSLINNFHVIEHWLFRLPDSDKLQELPEEARQIYAAYASEGSTGISVILFAGASLFAYLILRARLARLERG